MAPYVYITCVHSPKLLPVTSFIGSEIGRVMKVKTNCRLRYSETNPEEHFKAVYLMSTVMAVFDNII